MSSTDDGSAALFFADLLLPLYHFNLRRGISYLDRGPKRSSYWGEVITRTGGTERLPAGCDAACLFSLLGDYWKRCHEPDLPELLPYLEKLREDVSGGAARSAATDAPLTEFVYPMF